MKVVDRTNEQGMKYSRYEAECLADYPQFRDQEQKDEMIQAVQDHYADGKLVRGRQEDGEGRHCVLGIISYLGMWNAFGLENRSGHSKTSKMMVGINNDGMGGYRPNNEDRYDPSNLVTPKSYSELMMILKDSPVGEEK